MTALSQLASLSDLEMPIYGIVSEGAGFGDGGIFKMDMTLTRKQLIYSFSPEKGFKPMIPLIVHQGKLYGLLRRGGAERKRNPNILLI